MKNLYLTPLSGENACHQLKLAAVLLSVVPALSCFYIGSIIHTVTAITDMQAVILVLAFAGSAALAGYLLMRKYARSIVQLRSYITEVASGTLSGRIFLEQTNSSNDLKFIEFGFNTILNEMTNRLRIIEAKYKLETELRKALKEQQRILIHAERHRAMVQSIGAACHHLGQPATVLRMQLHMLKENAKTDAEGMEIEESIRGVDSICSVLQRLREVNEFRTVPYVNSENPLDTQILAI